ncbi:MAG: thiosulfate oxidation carrier protein SoxY, partial [Alphaproteobacteria bacterium]
MQGMALSRTPLFALVAVAAMALSAAAARADDPWPDIHRDVFDNRPIQEEDGTIVLEAPYRAEDAAIVPLTMHIPESAGDVKSLTLVIEKNPAPVAATFHFGSAAGKGDRTLSTRVRIDLYS